VVVLSIILMPRRVLNFADHIGVRERRNPTPPAHVAIYRMLLIEGRVPPVNRKDVSVSVTLATPFL